MSYTVPNWSQAQLAKAAGLDPAQVAVRMENDRTIVFLQYMPRKHIQVSKVDGGIVVKAEKRNDSRQHGQQTGQMKLPQ